jgi:aspartate aminotransferase/aminotransferase
MLTPEGLPAHKVDKVMLLNAWAKSLAMKQKSNSNETNKPMIFAGMGRPTYPLHPHTGKFLANYWGKHSGDAVDYGNPQGDLDARTIMAEAMSKWYNQTINANKILYTVGGAGALRSIFSALTSYHQATPGFRVITPFPFYSLYNDSDLKLHPIPVMNANGYNLTAESLLASIRSAYTLAEKDKGYPRALLLCDPNNPLGSVLGEKELKRIATVLRAYPEMTIILDEAYAEMVLDGTQHISLLKIAPDLKKRIILMRSATKGLSAAGERMAITIAFNQEIMGSILQHSIRTYGHAPRSLQIAYAETMKNFSTEDRIKLNNFYAQKVEYVKKRLVDMGAAMPDKNYQVSATFYILGDFSELRGEPLPQEASLALGKKSIIDSDEDIVYSLLFEESVMVAPGSYFGISKNKGYVRITCSAEMELLGILMDRLETRLKNVRLKKFEQYKQDINEKIQILEKIEPNKAKKISDQFNEVLTTYSGTTLDLQKQNKELKCILLAVRRYVNQSTKEGQIAAATVIQSAYRTYLAQKSALKINNEQEKKWQGFVDRVSPKPSAVRTYLQQLTVAERLELIPWKEHLQEKDKFISANFLLNLLSSPTMMEYASLLALIVLVTGIIGVCTLASVGSIGLATASMLSAGLALMGIGFFSKPSDDIPINATMPRVDATTTPTITVN